MVGSEAEAHAQETFQNPLGCFSDDTPVRLGVQSLGKALCNPTGSATEVRSAVVPMKWNYSKTEHRKPTKLQFQSTNSIKSTKTMEYYVPKV